MLFSVLGCSIFFEHVSLNFLVPLKFLYLSFPSDRYYNIAVGDGALQTLREVLNEIGGDKERDEVRAELHKMCMLLWVHLSIWLSGQGMSISPAFKMPNC